MNKNKLFKVFVMIAFIMCSCEDNFDPKMYGTLNVSNYPVTEAEYESFMMTCYMPFTTTWTYWIGAGTSGNQHGWYIPAGGVLKFFDYPTDEVAVWNNGWGGGYYFLSKADFSQCVYYTSSTLSDERPNHFPKVSEISYFTNVIGTLEKASTEVVSEERKREFIAEARLCRGLMMYYLLHVYGPVPLIVDPDDLINPSKLENLVRPTLQQMTEWIMADFDYAYQYIADTQPEQGRYNKDYARVCIMRHCLNEGYYMSGYYQKAIDMYNELKGRYSLFKKGDNPYIEQFKNANNFNSEVIMAVSCDETADGTNKSGNFNPLMMLATPDNAARVDDQGNPTPFYLQGQGWGQTFNVSPKFWDTYDPLDKRREVILTKYYTTAGTWIDRNTTTWDGFIINKFPVETATAFQGTDIPLARWADVLLMYAEAEVRKNNAAPSADAIAAVNEVRKRAGLGDLPSSATAPPMIAGYGMGNGFELYLQDKAGGNIAAFKEEADKFVEALSQRPEIGEVYSSFATDYPQYWVDIDAAKCEQSGVSPADVLSTLSGYYTGQYVSDFNRFSKLYHVTMQAPAEYRVNAESLHHMYVRATDGGMSPLSRFVRLTKTNGPSDLTRFNLFNAISISGSPAQGYSSGQVLEAIGETAREVLPSNYTYEFGGISREESKTTNNATLIFLLCMVLVYLILCALYESVFIPFAVLLSVPCGLMGSFLFAWLFGLENNIYMQTGLIMIIGLLAKTAILLTEYAGKRRSEGMTLAQAAYSAAKVRLRPILMTVLSMVFGLVPLMMAHGVGANGSRSLATGVIGGMIVGTLALLFLVPSLFIVFQYIQERVKHN